MTIRSVLCRLLGGHDLGIVPIWKDGRARLRCQYDCGFVTSGIDAPKTRDQSQRAIVTDMALYKSWAARRRAA